MRVARIVAGLVIVAMIVAVAYTAAVGLLGSGNEDDSDDDRSGSKTPFTLAPVPEPQPGSTEPPTPDLARFYSQRLTWAQCRGNFECATLEVPVDYSKPGGETIRLALLKDPADDVSRRVGSLVVNPGGPGAPGTSYAQSAVLVLGEPLRERFDIVGFDPRGTGESAPIDCLSDAELDEFSAADPDPDTPEEAQAAERAYEEFFAGCMARSGSIIGHVTTVEAARDMDVLRAALGEARLTYLGASYGTKLGATYAELFPTKVGRLLLDGAVDVSLDARQLNLEQARGFEVALRAYIQRCVDGDDCFLGGSLDEGLARVRALIADIEKSPLPTRDGGRELAVGHAFYGLVTPLYNRSYWLILDQALRAAFQGDGTLLLRLADIYLSRDGEGGYSDNSAEAILVINCLDDPYALRAEEVPAEIAAFEEASPTFGAIFAWGLIGCHGIQVEATDTVEKIAADGATPIVVIGTTRDPATPYQWAVKLAGQLSSGVLVTRDGDGHTGYQSGNDCIDEAVEAYLIDGVVPEDGLRC